MAFAPSLAWTLGDPPVAVDRRLLPLLIAIDERRSLAAAVAHCQLSYRSAWGLLRDYARMLDAPLVDLQRGRGAVLSALGLHLVRTERRAAEHLAPMLAQFATELSPPVPRARRKPARTQVRIAASHDLALAALRDRLARADGLQLELSFMGSLHALEAFAAGSVAIAGFHVPLLTGAAPVTAAPMFDAAPFRHLLRVRRDRLLHFVEREQGLMLPRGNPARVRNFRDLATRGLRFVNRQRGSGTRLLVEQLLQRDGVPAARIAGYATEEFTHPAVAATVACGGADAGFGLRAAAAAYGLAFVPLVRETYFLAVRAVALRQPSIQALITELRAPEFRQPLLQLPGYRSARAGEVATIGVLGNL